MSSFTGEIGLQLAHERMQRIHSDAARARLVRGRTDQAPAPRNTHPRTSAVVALFTRPVRSLRAAR